MTAAADRVLGPAEEAYGAGRYREAEGLAQRVIDAADVVARTPPQPSPQAERERGAGPGTASPAVSLALQERAEARSLMAYSAARREDLNLARVRFALAEREAAVLPDHGKPQAALGENPPALDEDSAYQHAVCTAALGDRAGAEREYLAFMNRYPESPLVSACVKRIARMHGGNVPPEAEAAWKAAMATGLSRQKARQRQESLCGPECIAAVLARGGVSSPPRHGDTEGTERATSEDQAPHGPLTLVSVAQPRQLVEELAGEMGTDERGTTMGGLAKGAQRHGLKAEGLRLTVKGLRDLVAQEALPPVALVMPGHYVLVEKVGSRQVSYWDPDGRGTGQGMERAVTLAEWGRMWDGAALALR